MTTIKIKTTFIKLLMLLCVMNATFACSNAKNNTPNATNENATVVDKAAESVTIKGTVQKITFGKDGYTADVQTENNDIYAALVSISNVGGPDNYKTCEVGDKVTFKGLLSTSSDVKSLMVQEIISIGSTDTQLFIETTSFRGIVVGDAIKKYDVDYVKKTKLKTAEGTFDAYAIKDFENNPAGYFVPDPTNKLLVGNITIETPKASTEKGIKVGSTFKDLLTAFPNIEVHGSESEGRTYADANNLSYRLDMPNFTYNVDKTKIPAKTKITEIVVNRMVKK